MLVSTGEEWDNFKSRFASQVSRLYGTKSYTSVKALVDDVAKSITVIRKGGDLYSTSNMAYFEKAKVKTHIIDTTTSFPNVKLVDNIHSDDNIQDHVYVYITEKSGTKLVTRLAVKDYDYYQIGNNIKLLEEALFNPYFKDSIRDLFFHKSYLYVVLLYKEMDNENVRLSTAVLRGKFNKDLIEFDSTCSNFFTSN